MFRRYLLPDALNSYFFGNSITGFTLKGRAIRSSLGFSAKEKRK